jgi:hypothetical protein
MIGAAASATAATQNNTSIPRTQAAAKPAPVTAASQGAMHKGHFGSNTSKAPGAKEGAALESRRVIMRLPRACYP